MRPIPVPFRILVVGVVGIVSWSAEAQAEGLYQWQVVQLSLFDLVQAGHRIVAVTYDQVQTDQEGNISGGDHTFFLQKNQEVDKCIESHASNMKSLETTGRMFCWKLVQPHPLREKK